MGNFTQFLQRKDVKLSFKAYFIDALSYMALGLFSSLIIGLIIQQIGSLTGIELLINAGAFAKSVTGASIGVAIAYSLNAPPLVLFSAAAVGFAGNDLGGPAGAYIATIISVELGKMASKETIVDIIVTPIVTIISGVFFAVYIGAAVGEFTVYLGNIIMWATELMPFFMGIVVSVVMGIVLTLPISSAALSIMLNLSGIAAGAACAGCSAHMVGFAVASYRENKVSGLLSQGLGTSMLQMPNIMKNPRIFLPAIFTSAIVGPISTVIFKMENVASGAGMGTSGLVGQFGTLEAMGYSMNTFVAIILVHFVLPAIICFLFSELLRKVQWIKDGDMKITT